MEIIIICIVAFFTAILTFFSGFGLGTILLPVFAIFFPVDIAIALTGIVHFSTNLFKMALTGRKADKQVLLRFGIPAVIASFAGAWMLLRITDLPPVIRYELMNKEFEVTPVKLIVSIILMTFSILEITPVLRNVKFSSSRLVTGGLISGFLGGLTGIQGAIRSAFLIKSGLPKEAYIATGVIIASLVDITRLSVYATRMQTSGLGENLSLIISAVISALAGALIGNMLLKKVTLRFIQILVSVMLIIISAAMAAGFI